MTMGPEILREKRAEMRISQAKLGKALGVSEMTVRRWEQGKAIPSILQAAVLEALFGVPLRSWVDTYSEASRAAWGLLYGAEAPC